jgi:hypothetical protein
VLNYAPRHEKVWGSGGIDLPFLTLALDGDEWLATRPGHFTPVEKDPGTCWVGGCVGPRASLDAVEKKKSLMPGIEPRPSNPHSVAVPTELSRLLHQNI